MAINFLTFFFFTCFDHNTTIPCLRLGADVCRENCWGEISLPPVWACHAQNLQHEVAPRGQASTRWLPVWHLLRLCELNQAGALQAQALLSQAERTVAIPVTPLLLDIVSEYAERTGDGRLFCKLCNHTTHKTYNMRVHLEGKHNLSSGYSCDICHIVKKTRHLLQQHKLVCSNKPLQYWSQDNEHVKIQPLYFLIWWFWSY